MTKKKQHLSVKGKDRIFYSERGKPNPKSYASGPRPWANHHVLPISSVARSISEAEVENLQKALRFFTQWNINDAGRSGNLIRLPTRRAFNKAYGKRGNRDIPLLLVSIEGHPIGTLACHSWAHMRYNSEVAKKLEAAWNNVSITIKKCGDWSANNVRKRLLQLQTEWKGTLTGRASTIENWKAMVDGDEDAHNRFTMVEVTESPF